MKLNELDKTPRAMASKALRENYEMPFQLNSVNRNSTKSMLQKVRGLIKESQQASNFYENNSSPAYMKLVFMEQALTDHLRSLPATRIVVENEEVDKSQVVLAAQDLVDSTQKMIEEVSDMLVKELPALVTSIQSEIGANESEQFNQQVTEALTSLQAALTQSKGTLQSALNGITGASDMGAFDAGMDAGEDLGLDAGAELGAEAGEEAGFEAGEEMAELPPEEEDIPPVGGVGRAKR